MLKHFRRSGFTLIELLVVITIIVILTTIGFASYAQTAKSARDARRKADLEQVRSALVQYRVDNGTYPTGTINWTTNMSPLYPTYINATTMKDPQGGLYVYTPQSCAAGVCRGFQLCATVEVQIGGSNQYCINNP